MSGKRVSLASERQAAFELMADRCAKLMGRIATLEDQLATVRAETVWQPIETAPRNGTEIILFFPTYKEGKVGAYRWKEPMGYEFPEWEGVDGWSFDEGPDGEDAPTHWRPLPAPPQDREVR